MMIVSYSIIDSRYHFVDHLGVTKAIINIPDAFAELPNDPTSGVLIVEGSQKTRTTEVELFLKTSELNALGFADGAAFIARFQLDRQAILSGGGGGAAVTVINTLTSTGTTEALSAAQGKVLKDEQDNITLSLGQGAGANNMGAFTGSTITDNVSVKAALQELETAIETVPTGGLNPKGVWDAATNTPDLTLPANRTVGDYYRVSNSGNTNLDGESDWIIGDHLFFGTNNSYNKIDNTDQVTSVFGRTGAIVATLGDYTAALIGINDAGGFFIATETEAALQELAATIFNKTPNSVLYVGADGKPTEDNNDFSFDGNVLRVGGADVDGSIFVQHIEKSDSKKGIFLLSSDMQLLDANASATSAPVIEAFVEGWDGTARVDTQDGRVLGGFTATIRKAGALFRNIIRFGGNLITGTPNSEVEFTIDMRRNDGVVRSIFKGNSETLDLTAAGYPNTREDQATTDPINFLYSDENGKILSAPKALTNIQNFYHLSAAFDFSALNTPNGVSIGFTNTLPAASVTIAVDNTKQLALKEVGDPSYGIFPAGILSNYVLDPNEHAILSQDDTTTYVTVFPVNGDRVFIDETTLAPAIAGSPIVAEIETYAANQGLRSEILVYNGTDINNEVYTYVFHVDKSQKVTIFRQPVTGGVNWQAVTDTPVLTENQGNIATNGANATYTLPPLASVNIGHLVAFMGGDDFTYTIQPTAGEQVNDIIDSQRFIEQDQKIFYVKKSATSWNATVENVTVEREVTLIDVDASNSTLYTFSTGETWANIKENYEYLIFTGNASQNGSSNVRPYSKVLKPANIDLLANNSGFYIELDDSLNSTNIGIQAPSDADVGFTTFFAGHDSPGNGRMQFTVIGIKKDFLIPAGTLIAENIGHFKMDGSGSTVAPNVQTILGLTDSTQSGYDSLPSGSTIAGNELTGLQGKFEIKWGARYASGDANSTPRIMLFKNGVEFRRIASPYNFSAVTEYITDTEKFNSEASDTWQIRFAHSSGGSTGATAILDIIDVTQKTALRVEDLPVNQLNREAVFDVTPITATGTTLSYNAGSDPVTGGGILNEGSILRFGTKALLLFDFHFDDDDVITLDLVNAIPNGANIISVTATADDPAQEPFSDINVNAPVNTTTQIQINRANAIDNDVSYHMAVWVDGYPNLDEYNVINTTDWNVDNFKDWPAVGIEQDTGRRKDGNIIYRRRFSQSGGLVNGVNVLDASLDYGSGARIIDVEGNIEFPTFSIQVGFSDGNTITGIFTNVTGLTIRSSSTSAPSSYDVLVYYTK